MRSTWIWNTVTQLSYWNVPTGTGIVKFVPAGNFYQIVMLPCTCPVWCCLARVSWLFIMGHQIITNPLWLFLNIFLKEIGKLFCKIYGIVQGDFKNLTKQLVQFIYVRFELLTAVLLSFVAGWVAKEFKTACQLKTKAIRPIPTSVTTLSTRHTSLEKTCIIRIY
jgi:hypothetical protein